MVIIVDCRFLAFSLLVFVLFMLRKKNFNRGKVLEKNLQLEIEQSSVAYLSGNSVKSKRQGVVNFPEIPCSTFQKLTELFSRLFKLTNRSKKVYHFYVFYSTPSGSPFDCLSVFLLCTPVPTSQCSVFVFFFFAAFFIFHMHISYAYFILTLRGKLHPFRSP